MTSTIDNGRRVAVDLPGYSGMAGLRDRGNTFDIAWFGRAGGRRAPFDAMVDGKACRITAVRVHPLNPYATTPSPSLTGIVTASGVFTDA